MQYDRNFREYDTLGACLAHFLFFMEQTFMVGLSTDVAMGKRYRQSRRHEFVLQFTCIWCNNFYEVKAH